MALDQPYTPGLNRYDAMQKQPLGAFSAMRRPSPVATQYKRQSEMYGQALRNLSRAARRGDAGAGIDAIRLRDVAIDNGFAPGGINRSEDNAGRIAGYGRQLEQSTMDLQAKSRLDRRLGAGLEREPMTMPTANPRASAGAGYGRPASPISFAPGTNVTNPAEGFQRVGESGPDGMSLSREVPKVMVSPLGRAMTATGDHPFVPEPDRAAQNQPLSRGGMIDGVPAKEYLSRMRGAPRAEVVTAGAPKAKPVSKTDQYLSYVEAYQAGLNDPEGGAAAKDADARATALYMGASDLEKARMSSALMKRAAELNRYQGVEPVITRRTSWWSNR